MKKDLGKAYQDLKKACATGVHGNQYEYILMNYITILTKCILSIKDDAFEKEVPGQLEQ